MSRPISHELICERCKKQFPVTLWQTVNVETDPRLKSELMKRRLFQFPCPRCRHVMDREYDVLYHDTKKSFMVWLKHPADDGVTAMLSEPLDLAGLLRPEYRLRLVTKYGALIEKIHCFDNDLDDRVIELVKVAVYHQLYAADLDCDALFYFAGLQKSFWRKSEMNFVSVTSAGEHWYHVPFSPMYDVATQQLHQICRTPAPVNQWLLVNRRYLGDLSRQ
jgi:hypothetical protein